MRISDWSSDVCSSDLYPGEIQPTGRPAEQQAPGDDADHQPKHYAGIDAPEFHDARYGGRAELFARPQRTRSEEHTSELQSLMRISYAVFCLKKKKHISKHLYNSTQILATR